MDSIVEERGLVILVPEAEAFVRSFRAKYESLAASDSPAHITINHPFAPASEPNSRLEEVLTDLFSGIAAFQFALTEVRMFPTALYLTPEPEERFKTLIAAIADLFPESPPYEGQFDDIIPHLTVAYLEDSEEINGMNDALSTMAEGVLPITGKVTKVNLIERVGGEWRERTSFYLAA